MNYLLVELLLTVNPRVDYPVESPMHLVPHVDGDITDEDIKQFRERGKEVRIYELVTKSVSASRPMYFKPETYRMSMVQSSQWLWSSDVKFFTLYGYHPVQIFSLVKDY
jgi:hypothetical protein